MAEQQKLRYELEVLLHGNSYDAAVDAVCLLVQNGFMSHEEGRERIELIIRIFTTAKPIPRL